MTKVESHETENRRMKTNKETKVDSLKRAIELASVQQGQPRNGKETN